MARRKSSSRRSSRKRSRRSKKGIGGWNLLVGGAVLAFFFWPKKAATALPTAASSATEEMTYTVKPGDTLSKLAQRFYGHPQEWPKIYQANRDVVSNPNVIEPGWKLVIPAAE